MKKLIAILFVVLLTTSAFSQGTIRTYPLTKVGGFVFGSASDYAVLGSYGDGVDTSNAFSISGWEGAVNLFMVGDTTDADSAKLYANTSDSCLAVRLQIKDNDIGWGGLYSETTNNYTLLDTVDRAKANSAGDVIFYFPLALEDSWAPGDSARFIFYIGVGDTLPFKAKIGNGSY